MIMWQFILQIAVYLLAAALIGGLVGWFLGRLRLAARFKARITELETALHEAQQALATARNEQGIFAARATKMESELATSQTLLKAREATVAEQNTRARYFMARSQSWTGLTQES
jgi:K+-sensing histidine kinase KdpD